MKISRTVRALKQIGRQLGKRDWNFEVDPCSRKGNWIIQEETEGRESNLTCQCSSSSCHVVSMYSSASPHAFAFAFHNRVSSHALQNELL